MLFLFYTHLTAEFPELLESLRDDFPDHDFHAAGSREEFDARLPDAEAVVTAPMPQERLEQAKHLRIQFIPFTGVNSVPLEYFRHHGLLLSSSHGNASVVAERALQLALAVRGRVVEFHNDLARGRWHRRDDPWQPFDYWSSLQQRSCAILGTGAIAGHLAGLLQGFRCRIFGFNRSGRNPDQGRFHRVSTDLHRVLSECDIAFLTLPLTPDTRGLLGSRELGLLRGKHLVNVARGAIIDEAAVYHALLSGELAGAGIDAWYQYPDSPTGESLPSEYPFHELSNVVMSPHAASHAVEGKRLQLEGAAENIRRYLETGTPGGLVDLERGY